MVSEHLPAELVARLSDVVQERIGLYYPPEKWRDLERGVRGVAAELQFDDVATCVEWLTASPLTKDRVDLLASHLTIGETYFYRDPKIFDALEQHILPELIARRRPRDRQLRMWSAGCCTGEEPYSLAMALHRLVPDLAQWRLTLLGTDLNGRFLQCAQRAVYGEWSFRGAPSWIRERYFRHEPGGRREWHLKREIAKLVAFDQLNLVEDPYPSLFNNTNAMDVIFCRNVLMYFESSRAQHVVDQLHHALTEGGWLVVSPSEVSHFSHSAFSAVRFPGVVLLQKDAGRAGRTRSIGTAPSPAPPRVTAAPPTPPRPRPRPAPAPAAARQAPTPYEAAVASYEQGDYSGAVAQLRGLLDSGDGGDRGQAAAMALLGRAYANQGALAEAQAWCERAAAADKLNPRYHYLLATVLLERGQVDDARQALERTLFLDEKFVLAHFALGNVTRRQNRAGEARRYFGNALSLLRGYGREDVLPESEGMTAGRLSEVIEAMTPR